MCRKYATMFQRLVANSTVDEATGCWVWDGPFAPFGYPKINVWASGKTVTRRAHRVMLEEVLQADFPLDEAGHLCNNPSCINPQHLEVQTKAHNLSERRGYGAVDRRDSWIPVLFPRADRLQDAADRAWDDRTATAGAACPF